MCGRYTLKKKPEQVAEHFHLPEIPDLGPRYNIAPSQEVAAIKGDLSFVTLKWGFIPRWSKEPKASFSNINAKRETVASSRAYGDAFRKRRCLLPADGFFEWQPSPEGTKGPKTPYHFHLKDDGLFAFAGIWERWEHGEPFESCALLTTEANGVVNPVHGRMPVILLKEDYGRWLDPKATPDALMALLGPLPADLMEGYAVSTAVNRPAYDGVKCVEPSR